MEGSLRGRKSGGEISLETGVARWRGGEERSWWLRRSQQQEAASTLCRSVATRLAGRPGNIIACSAGAKHLYPNHQITHNLKRLMIEVIGSEWKGGGGERGRRTVRFRKRWK